MSTPSPKRPMTEEEIIAAKMLQGVTFPVASWDKRAAATLAIAMTPPPPPVCNCQQEVPQLFPTGMTHRPDCPALAPPWVPMIGEKMVPQLWRLIQRYRRQLKHPERAKYVRMAEKLAAPDFRKQQAALREQARIDEAKQKYAEAMRLRLWSISSGEMLCEEDAAALKEWDEIKNEN